jgi:rhamnose transport system permease protein
MIVGTAPPTVADTSRRLLERVSRAREVGIVVAVLVVFLVTTAKNPAFANGASVQQLLAGASLVALIGAGETLVIVTRNVDLSVGSVLGLSAYLVGLLFQRSPDTPLVTAYALGIGVGALCGLVNGVVTAVLRVPSLVVTLAALYIIRGIDALVVDGKQIDPTSIPERFQRLGSGSVFHLPYLTMLVVAVILVVWYSMRSFRSGRDLYAIGSNPQAAALAGIPAVRRVVAAFVVCGALAGLSGVLFLSQFATVAATAGVGYEFLVVAAVVVGGVAIFGGSGSVIGAALGALLLNTINQALVAAQVSAHWNRAVAGFLLLAAIAFDRSVALRVNRALLERRETRRGE